MVIVFLLVLGVINVLAFAFAIKSVIAIRSHFFAFRNALQTFVTPVKDGELSPMGQMVDLITTDMSSKMGTTVQAAIRGSVGGTMKSTVAALEQEGAEQNPIFAALPKKIQNNALAQMGLQAIFQKVLSGQNGVNNGGSPFSTKL